MRKIYMVLCGFLVTVFSFGALAQEPNSPLTFKVWRDQQVVAAQNELARISNKMVLVKSGRLRAEDASAADPVQGSDGDSSELQGLTSRAQRATSRDSLERLERELQRSRKAVEITKDFGVQDFLVGYLSQFQNNPEALAQAASKLSKEEVLELLRSVLRLSGQGSAKSSHALEASARAQGL